MTALAALGVPWDDADGAGLRSGRDKAAAIVIRDDLEHATHLLQALLMVYDSPSADVLRSALTDELELLRRRVLAGLSIRYGVEGLSKVGFQLAQPNPRFHALALEWLDVTLVGTDRAVVALLEPELSAHRRMRLLVRSFPVLPTTPRTVLIDLAEDRDDRWRRPWIAACALLVASDVPELGLEALARAESPVGNIDDQTGIVRETLVAIGQRQIARHLAPRGRRAHRDRTSDTHRSSIAVGRSAHGHGRRG